MHNSCLYAFEYFMDLIETYKGDKLVKIIYGDEIINFWVNDTLEIYYYEAESSKFATDNTHLTLRLAMYEAIIQGGSIIIRQIGTKTVNVMNMSLKMDEVSAGRFTDKGLRPLSADELKEYYPKIPEMTVFKDMPRRQDMRLQLKNSRKTKAAKATSATNCLSKKKVAA